MSSPQREGMMMVTVETADDVLAADPGSIVCAEGVIGRYVRAQWVSGLCVLQLDTGVEADGEGTLVTVVLPASLPNGESE